MLRGKKSGQTIQDVGIYSIHAYFSLLPKLTRAQFMLQVENFVQQGYIELKEDGYYQLTAHGQAAVPTSIPIFFDGWHYRGNEHIFFARLSLIIQALSYATAAIKAFTPIEREERIQHFARLYLVRHQYKAGALQAILLQELLALLEESNLTDQQKEIIVSRLTGYELPGLTWRQLAMQMNLAEIDIQLLYISALHQMLTHIAKYPYLAEIAHNVRLEQPITDSASHTAHLFTQGYTIAQIAQKRQLKISTIEDHIVEIAMNREMFDIRHFVTEEERRQVIEAVAMYKTKKLKVLRERLPHLSYFQLRLILAKGSE